MHKHIYLLKKPSLESWLLIQIKNQISIYTLLHAYDISPLFGFNQWQPLYLGLLGVFHIVGGARDAGGEFIEDDWLHRDGLVLFLTVVFIVHAHTEYFIRVIDRGYYFDRISWNYWSAAVDHTDKLKLF